MIRRASATARSSCPTWTPSASQATARSGRSLTTNSAPASRVSRRNVRPASTICSSDACLSRSWTTSTPPASASSRSHSSRGAMPVMKYSRASSSTRPTLPLRRYAGASRAGLRGRNERPPTVEPDPGHAGAGRRIVEHFDVVVVGGGPIGLACAWRAQQRGLRVVVLERDRVGAGAASVAAGRLAPTTEADFGEDELLRINLDSLRAYPAFVAELEAESGV